MTVLIDTPTYQSKRHDDGSYSIRLTHNGGVSWYEFTIEIEQPGHGTMRGGIDDVHDIIADGVDIPFDSVPDYLSEYGIDEFTAIELQIQNDREVWMRNNTINR